MLLYEMSVRDELRRATEYAKSLEVKFEAKADVKDLARDAEHLGQMCERVRDMLPEEVKLGNLFRHLYFMSRNLARDDPDASAGDIRDICHYDLPEIERAFAEWTTGKFDAELAEKMKPLLAHREWDSAIRKAFPILKARLVQRFGMPEDIDGIDLVNRVFGRSSDVSGLDDDARQAWRDLLAGLYGVYRNKYHHNDLVPPWHDVDAVLSMVNAALIAIDGMQTRKKPRAK